MALSSHPSSDRLIAKLESSAFPLSDGEREAVLSLPMQVIKLRADQDIVREGDRPSRSALIAEGFACTYKVTGDGRRQIQAFHIPGDIPDLQSLHLRVLDNSVSTISPCTVAFVQHEVLHDVSARFPRIVAALWRETLIDAAIFREWMTGIGRREAYARVAHLLCEMMVRMRAVGLAQDHSCDLPITQAEFADACGLSGVHMNRVLQQLRSEGLIVLKGTTLLVPDWEKLKAAGDFDPTYLHLVEPKQAA